MRQLLRLVSGLIIIVSIFLCLLAFLRVLHSQSKLPPSFFKSRRSHAFIHEDQFKGLPKVAFLFLVRQDLPLDFLWDTFFKNGDVAKFSIYIHSEPGFAFDESPQAVCLCTTSVTFCNYVMSSPRSFVDSFIDVKGFRYDPKMSPTIPEERWRKGSQWITLVRRHAEIVVDDHTVCPVFRKFCKVYREALSGPISICLKTVPKYRNCIPDEHYVQRLLADIDHAYYEYEQHTEFCHTGSKIASCYLFARKFTVGAAMLILREGLIGPYDVTAIPNM
ncbi:hypothetical protein GBA52_011245 [Prunus armeniaca]|nr:hypothetical protein GBA52_011245 [Prunus armeniaca]